MIPDDGAEPNPKKHASAPPLTVVHTLTGHVEPRVWHVAWNPAGDTLTSCGEDRSIRLWAQSGQDGSAWHCVAVLEEGHQRTIRCCAWSPDARFLASCSFDGTSSIWECIDGDFDCVASLEGHENEVKAVAWSASGQQLATCGRDKSVFVWEVEGENYEVAGVLHSHAADVKAVRWHPTQEILASGSYDDTLKLFSQGEEDEWACFATLAGHTSTVWGLTFSPDGRSLASCSDDRSVMLWRDATGEGGFVHSATVKEVHERAIYSIDWGSSGLIATGGADDAVAVLRPSPDCASLEVLGVASGAHAGDVNAVAWRPGDASRPGGDWLASCGDDGTLRLWRPNCVSSVKP